MKRGKIVLCLLVLGGILVFANIYAVRYIAKADIVGEWRQEPDQDGKMTDYWYENSVKQGVEGRGKEIYDPASDAWYWLDAVQGGAKTVDKDVYQESDGGKWVRYDSEGHMVKGEDSRDGAEYFFEQITGMMIKGPAVLEDGRKVFYDVETGRMLKGEQSINGEVYVFDETDGHLLSGREDKIWIAVDGKQYWYENWQRQGWKPGDRNYRGKEIFDPASDAWYWLDNVQQGAMAVSKDVYQESLAGEWGDTVQTGGEKTGKWVRYDAAGHMIKGWDTNEWGTFYFDEVYGTMAKGNVTIEGKNYVFDSKTGILAENLPADQEQSGDARTLVAYFSCTGNTEKIAKEIADILSANLYEIVPQEAYTKADLDYSNKGSRATLEQNDPSARPAIWGQVEDMDQYDTVFLGYPIWWGTPPKIIYTFVENYHFEGKTIIPFCTSHSSGYNDGEISSIAIGGTVLRGQRFPADADKREVQDWLSGYGLFDFSVNEAGSVEKFDLAAGTNGNAPTVMLNSGYQMPVAGIGTYSLTGQTCIDSIKSALEQGVRLIDTAYMYGNEKEVGQAVREFMQESGVSREEIFVITKIYPGEQFSNPEKAIQDALEKLDIGYIDARVIIGLS